MVEAPTTRLGPPTFNTQNTAHHTPRAFRPCILAPLGWEVPAAVVRISQPTPHRARLFPGPGVSGANAPELTTLSPRYDNKYQEGDKLFASAYVRRALAMTWCRAPSLSRWTPMRARRRRSMRRPRLRGPPCPAAQGQLRCCRQQSSGTWQSAVAAGGARYGWCRCTILPPWSWLAPATPRRPSTSSEITRFAAEHIHVSTCTEHVTSSPWW